MYENFFGFKEKPFKLVPNPDYLFLSKSHEEALAHLNYALSQGDGFVEITGEVGTGKTTLCRTFLENLDDDTTAAYIFNPKLGPKQLIQTINDELGIKYNTDSTKDLIDNLNNFLMRQKTQRKKVILLIDEAQNLNKNVLEQLRLLSNLETNREKLLQIILVGQPELSNILDSHELRQLGQRITLRYHLTPLTPRETVDYIQYRINIAAQKSGIKFDRAAYRLIYQYSQGIPRLINITCDRVLLTAFGLSKHKINGGIARESVKELKSRGGSRKFDFLNRKKLIILSGSVGLILAAGIFHQPLKLDISSLFRQTPNPKLEASTTSGAVRNPTEASPPEAGKNSRLSDLKGSSLIDPNDTNLIKASGDSDLSTTENSGLRVSGDSNLSAARDFNSEYSAETTLVGSASLQEPEAEELVPDRYETINLSDYMPTMDLGASRHSALQDAMELWQTPMEVQPYLNSLDDDQAFFRLAAKPKGVSIHRIETNLVLLKRLNLPAILELYPADSEVPGYLTLSKIEGEKLTFIGPNEYRMVVSDAGQINLYWSGTAYIPWKNFLSIWGIIPKHSNEDSIIILKLLLLDLGFKEIEINDKYDNWTRQAIEEVQAKYGIPVDGYVGPLTKMILYQEKDSFEMPHLTN